MILVTIEAARRANGPGIAEHGAMRMTGKHIRLSVSCISVLLAACGPGEEPLPDELPVVSGVATGVVEPVTIQLDFPGGSEVLVVTEDGPFAFTTQLDEGDLYNVGLPDEPPCVLENAGGRVGGPIPEVGLACAGVLLADLALSGPAMPDVGLTLEQSSYALDVPLLQQRVQVTATAMSPESTITVAGTVVASGMPSEPLALNLGENAIDIVVEHTTGATRTYRLDVRRAAAVAQYVYGKASNADETDIFGFSVALSGDTLAVGATLEDGGSTGVNGDQSDNGALSSGAVYVFRRNGSTWQQEAYLKASNADEFDLFGYSVALSGDTLAVGARYEGNQNDFSDHGAVYVFTRGAAGWQQEAYIKPPSLLSISYFGDSLALSGNTLAIGAPNEDSDARGVNGDPANTGAEASGAVHVFTRDATGWKQQAYLKSSNSESVDFFGQSVALSGDLLAVGVVGEDGGSRGVDGDQEDDSRADSGAVYVFRRTGETWQQEAYLKASNADAGDSFGQSVALSGDLLAVGAVGEDSATRGSDGQQEDESAADSGAVYVFHRSGSTWQQEAYLKVFTTGARGSSLIA
jgi:hypothetical protein